MKNIMHQHTVDCAKHGRISSREKSGACAGVAQEVQLTLTHITGWATLPAGRPSHAVSVSPPLTLLSLVYIVVR